MTILCTKMFIITNKIALTLKIIKSFSWSSCKFFVNVHKLVEVKFSHEFLMGLNIWCSDDSDSFSKVHLLVVLSNFAQCLLPCGRLNPVTRIPWAPSTVQKLKVPLIDELLKLTLLSLHHIFRPYIPKHICNKLGT